MIIKEFLPNPVGADKDGEYIKLFNDGKTAISLNGWTLKDLSGKIYKLNGILETSKELTLYYSHTGIPLNNNGEKIFLYNNKEELVDELGYSGNALEGEIVLKKEQKITQGEDLKYGSQMNADSQVVINKSSFSKIVFIDFFVAAILAGFILYIILKLEEKWEIKLF